MPFCAALALTSGSWEDTIRRAVAFGGDCDTTAGIAGAIAGGAYPIPEAIQQAALQRLPNDLREVITHFEAKFSSD